MIKTRKEFEEKNARRIVLIVKEFDEGGLDEEERRELEGLQGEVGEYVRRKHPLPIAELRAILKRLKRGEWP